MMPAIFVAASPTLAEGLGLPRQQGLIVLRMSFPVGVSVGIYSKERYPIQTLYYHSTLLGRFGNGLGSTPTSVRVSARRTRPLVVGVSQVVGYPGILRPQPTEKH